MTSGMYYSYVGHKLFKVHIQCQTYALQPKPLQSIEKKRNVFHQAIMEDRICDLDRLNS